MDCRRIEEKTMNTKLKIETAYTADGIIIQDDIFVDQESVVNIFNRCLIDVREKQIRDALIALGWTPPKQN